MGAAAGNAQALDTVDSFNATAVIEMQFHDPDRTQDFINLGLVGTSHLGTASCTALDGMFCLDRQIHEALAGDRRAWDIHQ